MRLVFRQIVVNERWLWRIVELVLDILDLGNLREFANVKRAVVVRETIRTIETGYQRLGGAFAVLAGNGINLVD